MYQNQNSNKDKTSLSEPTIFLATWFGAGLLPKAPGTWGTLASIPFAWILHSIAGWQVLAGACFTVFCIGIWAANGYLKFLGGEDPGPVVIDEVAGMWLTLMPAAYFYPCEPDVFTYVVAFILFRLADIYKPWPTSWADKKIKGGLGIMIDDIIAATFSGFGVTLYIISIES
jgi:phosphatidylglycerophosphatase A